MTAVIVTTVNNSHICIQPELPHYNEKMSDSSFLILLFVYPFQHEISSDFCISLLPFLFPLPLPLSQGH